MTKKVEIIVIAVLIVANVVMIADSLFDYKMDKFLDVNVNMESGYIYKKIK